MKNRLLRGLRSDDLIGLATFWGTDKWGNHRYAQHYATHFRPVRKRVRRVLEIGIGGHTDPRSGGASLRMWKQFFPRATIYGVDIHDKSPHREHRIEPLQGSQSDPEFLQKVIERAAPFDIIIDDGSHVVSDVRCSFDHLFPHLADGGLYVIEDLQTSYWPEFGGSADLDAPETTMGWLKSRIDGLNHEEFGGRGDPLDGRITAVHCYHNLVFLEKGENCEGSNMDIVRSDTSNPPSE